MHFFFAFSNQNMNSCVSLIVMYHLYICTTAHLPI